MFKRSITFFVVIMIVLSFMVGCTKSDTKSGSATTKPVTISYISSTILEKPEGVFEQQKIDAFNALDNNITVVAEGVMVNDLEKKYIALSTANQMPDFCIGAKSTLLLLADMGQAVDVRNIFDDEYLKGFTKADMEGGSIDGVPYGIPWFGMAQAVLYRKDIFEANNIKIPQTWDEFASVAKSLTKNDNYGITIVGIRGANGTSRFQAVLRNFGVDEFVKGADGKWNTDVGSQKYINALRAYTDLDLKYHAAPPGVIETDYPEAVNFFSSGKAAMLITGSNAIGAITTRAPELKGKLGSFTIPTVERNVTVAAGFYYMINPKTQYKKEVAEFIKFMLSNDNAFAFAELTGRRPTRLSVSNDPRLTGLPEMQGFLKAAENVYVAPTIPGYAEMNDIHAEAYQNVFTKLATVEEAAKKAKERAQAVCNAANG